MTEETEDERDIELASIAAIFPELIIDPLDLHKASLEIEVSPTIPLTVTFTQAAHTHTYASVANLPPCDTQILSHLPSLRLRIDLPEHYPNEEPPHFHLSADPPWLPAYVIIRLEKEGRSLWEEYGRSQIVYAYIDYLQQEAERGFGLADDRCWELPQVLKPNLVEYDRRVKRRKFEGATYECGVCLEPKKGSACYKLRRCGHVFCVSCLQDFYNSAITEGDIANVKCLDPDCGKKNLTATQKRTKKSHSLHPSELLAIPLPDTQVQRFVELKLKKKLESDKNTIYCPRKWCQGPAKSPKWDKFSRFNRHNLDEFPESDSESEEPATTATHALPPPNSNLATKTSINPRLPTTLPPDRLSVCSKCEFAFCRLCQRSWHGDYLNCNLRSPAELSAEEQASYDYIRQYTSPCPTCASPCQKTHGCNHMRCFQCNTHFCYLCSAWLNPDNPYKHFNERGKDCFERLWELEAGDEGPENREAAHFVGARAAEMAAVAAEVEAMQIREIRAAEEEAERQRQGIVFVPWRGRRGVDELIDAL